MATHTAAARRSHARRHAAAPRHARRVSGPIARPVPSVALPQPAAPQLDRRLRAHHARCPSTGWSTGCCAGARGSG